MDWFSFVEGIAALQATIFLFGLFLMIVEVFTAGFGVAGGAGLALMVLGIILTARTAFEATVMVIILLLIVAVLLVVIIRSSKKGLLSRKMILNLAATKENGFNSVDDVSVLLGKEGMALTILRPAGSGDFDGQRVDVVTEGAFIDRGVKIKVIRTEGRRIVVEPAE